MSNSNWWYFLNLGDRFALSAVKKEQADWIVRDPSSWLIAVLIIVLVIL